MSSKEVPDASGMTVDLLRVLRLRGNDCDAVLFAVDLNYFG